MLNTYSQMHQFSFVYLCCLSLFFIIIYEMSQTQRKIISFSWHILSTRFHRMRTNQIKQLKIFIHIQIYRKGWMLDSAHTIHKRLINVIDSWRCSITRNLYQRWMTFLRRRSIYIYIYMFTRVQWNSIRVIERAQKQDK